MKKIKKRKRTLWKTKYYEDMRPVKYNCACCSNRRLCGCKRSLEEFERNQYNKFERENLREKCFITGWCKTWCCWCKTNISSFWTFAFIGYCFISNGREKIVSTNANGLKRKRKIMRNWWEKLNDMMHISMNKWTFISSWCCDIEGNFFRMKIMLFPWASCVIMTWSRKIAIFRFETF